MKDKIVLVTGSTDGIGEETALELAEKEANVLIHGRDEEKCKETLNKIKDKTGNENLDYFVADFSSLDEVKKLAEGIKNKYDRFDVLLNNAGIYMNERKESADGFEMTFAVNHLAPFLLTQLLLDLVKKSNYSRIINVSSIAHTRANLDFDNLNQEKRFDAYGAYALSKLGNVLFTVELANKLNKNEATANCLHPGVIETKLLHKGFGISGGSLEEGAETSVYLTTSNEVDNVTGKYFVRKKEKEPNPVVFDDEKREKFWKLSEEMVGLS